MNYRDIINFVFNNKEDEELFDLEDSEREKFKNSSEMVYDELIKFIDSRVHPKSRNKLKHLLLKYDEVECGYLRKENELFYRNGVADGVKFIITALTIKWYIYEAIIYQTNYNYSNFMVYYISMRWAYGFFWYEF